MAHGTRSSIRLGGLGVLALVSAALLGILAGLGTFTFVYADGDAYLSSDPTACTNCHIMQEYFDTWQKSGHHHVAVCVDCHLPHDFLGKYVAKADNGFFHSLAFTTGDFHEPIQIKARNRHITQNNCLACHRDMVHDTLPATPEHEVLSCIHCHHDVGHSLK